MWKKSWELLNKRYDLYIIFEGRFLHDFLLLQSSVDDYGDYRRPLGDYAFDEEMVEFI